MNHLYDASPAHLRKLGLKAKDADKLLVALCTLADYEGVIAAEGGSVSGVCDAIRKIVDGQGCEESCCAAPEKP